ncbi:MAG: hypothetical protein ABIQ95_12195 [Bdellovibrionia bacterium]
MRKISLAVLSFAVLSCWNSNITSANQPTDSIDVEIPIKALLTPYTGYEEKNTVEAVLYGTLPSSCYTLGSYRTEQNDSNHTITVRQFATRQITGVCADETRMPEHLKMSVPFTSEVHVGNLPAGDYKFIFNKMDGKQGLRMMNVAPNQTLTVDSLPYALISGVSAPDVVNGKDDLLVKISGVLNSSCTKLDDKVQVTSQDDVSVLLPTVSIKPGVVCAQALIPFEKQVNLGKTESGVHLIHARSMNGRAVNKVIQVSN